MSELTAFIILLYYIFNELNFQLNQIMIFKYPLL